MGGRAKKSIISALEHEGWKVYEGMEPGTIDIEAHKGPLLWLVCVSEVLKGESEREAMPSGRRLGHLIAAAKERGATAVVGLSTGEGVTFKLAADSTVTLHG